MSSPTGRGLTQFSDSGRYSLFPGRNEFPDVKGIDTSVHWKKVRPHYRRNEFPGVKGIDTILR